MFYFYFYFLKVSALWKPNETTTSLQVLNEETQKNARVFMTIAVDLVLTVYKIPFGSVLKRKFASTRKPRNFGSIKNTSTTSNSFCKLLKQLLRRHCSRNQLPAAAVYPPPLIHRPKAITIHSERISR